MLAGARRNAMRICSGANNLWLVMPALLREHSRGQHQHNLRDIKGCGLRERAVTYTYFSPLTNGLASVDFSA